jgi:hypothetical protein
LKKIGLPSHDTSRVALQRLLGFCLSAQPWPVGFVSLLAGFLIASAPGIEAAELPAALSNEFIPELPTVWVRSLEMRSSVGYKDNLILSHEARDQSISIANGLDIMLARLPLDGRQVNFFVSFDDTRYPQGARMDHEDLLLAVAQFKVDLCPTWKVGMDVRNVYQDQVIDISVTEANLEATVVRGNGLAMVPNVRWAFSGNAWLEFAGTAQRQFFRAPLDDYWEGGPKLSLGYDYGHRSSLSLGYAWNLRDYDTRQQVSLEGAHVPGTSLQFIQNEAELVWRHHWEAQRRWRTTARLGFQHNQDNGPGYFDYDRYAASVQVRYVAPTWEVKGQARSSVYDFARQFAGPTDSSFRLKTIISTGVHAEKTVWKKLKLFAEYEHEHSLSNRAVDEYRANGVAGGVAWEF